MHEIDGSYGEGGGQLVRTAVALSAITGQAVRVRHIRARRNNSGLAPQHLTAVRAVAALCDATVEGLAVKSTEIEFLPGKLHGGQFSFDVGTAGSIPLVIEALLPAAVACGEAFHIHISGGTDVRAAPPLDYLRLILLPILSRMGIQAHITVRRRGYYPRGGGDVEFWLRPMTRLLPLILDAPGALMEIRACTHVANLPEHVAPRMTQAAGTELAEFPQMQVEQQVLGGEQAIGAGGTIVLTACTEHTTLGASATAERGIPAERLGMQAGQELRAELMSGATLDLHATDQILIYLALAAEPCRFLARSLTSHASTTIWLLEQFLPVRFVTTAAGKLVQIATLPGPR